MQASVSPWQWWRRELPAERRRVRLTLQQLQHARGLQLERLQQARELQLQWVRLRPDIAVFTPDELRHYIRMEGGAPAATLAPWLRDRYPPVWTQPQLAATYKVEKAGSSSLRWWSGGACAGGAALLAVLLLLLRDSCRTRLRTIRRRLSDEWPTPNVLATSLTDQPHEVTIILPDHADDSGGQSAGGPGDLPPPYSECAGPPAAPGKSALSYDEPPPPYSACHVPYAHKDDPPEEPAAREPPPRLDPDGREAAVGAARGGTRPGAVHQADEQARAENENNERNELSDTNSGASDSWGRTDAGCERAEVGTRGLARLQVAGLACEGGGARGVVV